MEDVECWQQHCSCSEPKENALLWKLCLQWSKSTLPLGDSFIFWNRTMSTGLICHECEGCLEIYCHFWGSFISDWWKIVADIVMQDSQVLLQWVRPFLTDGWEQVLMKVMTVIPSVYCLPIWYNAQRTVWKSYAGSHPSFLGHGEGGGRSAYCSIGGRSAYPILS